MPVTRPGRRRDGGPALNGHPGTQASEETRERPRRTAQRQAGATSHLRAGQGAGAERTSRAPPQAPPSGRALIGAAAEGRGRRPRAGRDLCGACAARGPRARAGGRSGPPERGLASAGRGPKGRQSRRAPGLGRRAEAHGPEQPRQVAAAAAEAAEAAAASGGPGGSGGGGSRSRARWSGRGGSARRSRRAGRGKKCPEGRGCRPATGMSFTIGE